MPFEWIMAGLLVGAVAMTTINVAVFVVLNWRDRRRGQT